MAQSSDEMQEPGMDELLASIQEIIEENAGLSPSGGGGCLSDDSNRFAKADNTHLHQESCDTDSPGIKRASHITSESNSVPPVQDAMNALAERIGLRKTPILPTAHPKAESRFSESSISHVQSLHKQAAVREADQSAAPIEKQPRKKRDSSDAVKDKDELDKGFRNDVERSAETLLRSYISQWLDEHFRQLFERILREEVQRFIKALRH